MGRPRCRKTYQRSSGGSGCVLTINQWELASVYTISDRTYQINFPLILNSNHVRVIVQVSHMFVTRILKGTPSIPETYLSSSVAWGLNLRVG